MVALTCGEKDRYATSNEAQHSGGPGKAGRKVPAMPPTDSTRHTKINITSIVVLITGANIARKN